MWGEKCSKNSDADQGNKLGQLTKNPKPIRKKPLSIIDSKVEKPCSSNNKRI